MRKAKSRKTLEVFLPSPSASPSFTMAEEMRGRKKITDNLASGKTGKSPSACPRQLSLILHRQRAAREDSNNRRAESLRERGEAGRQGRRGRKALELPKVPSGQGSSSGSLQGQSPQHPCFLPCWSSKVVLSFPGF